MKVMKQKSLLAALLAVFTLGFVLVSTPQTAYAAGKSISLSIDQKEYVADESGMVTITGKTKPKAKVSVGFGIVGDTTTADKDGKFSLDYELTSSKSKKLTIRARKGSKSAKAKVLVKPSATVSQSTTSTSSSTTSGVKIGEALTVGDVSYVVNSVSQAATVGDEFLNEQASGVYLVVNVTVTNNGKENLSISDSFFKVKKGDTTYEVDSTASIYANDNDTGFWLGDMNPGISKTSNLVFDVPADVAASTDLVLQVQTGYWSTQKGLINLHQ